MKKNKIENVIKKISEIRKKRGYSYENMADELFITPAAYRKIETGKTKLTIERLFRISEILDNPVANFLDINDDIFRQTNRENVTDYQQKIENFHQENKDVYEKLLQAKDKQIILLESMLNNK